MSFMLYMILGDTMSKMEILNPLALFLQQEVSTFLHNMKVKMQYSNSPLASQFPIL